VDLRQRRLARHDDQRAPLFEGDVGGAVQERARGAQRDVGGRGHGARADDDGVGSAAPARRQGAEVIGRKDPGGRAGALEEGRGHGRPRPGRQAELMLEHEDAVL
jgi:hypothetical protein